MIENDGLIFAYLLDGKGGGRELDWEGIHGWKPGDGPLWVHLDYTGHGSSKWLDEKSGLPRLTFEALVSEDPRPRAVTSGDSLMVILRGVNINPGAAPDDLVAVRAFIDGERMITLRHRRVVALDDIQEELLAGHGPVASGDFLVELAHHMMERIGPVVSELDDMVDALEDEVLTAESYGLRPRIASMRRQAITLRRYLAPQRDVLSLLPMERVSWLSDMDRLHLREAADINTRYVEDLDSARERASVTHEELDSRLSEQMNKTMYLLSLVATIFLPLSFLTGLLGINVGGIPGADTPWAFYAVCAVAAVVTFVQVMIFKRKRWM